MKTDFAVGDVVKLKSGGHFMTVQGLEKPNGDILDKPESDFRVRAVWMDENGRMHSSHGLMPAMLESVSEVDRDKDAAGNDFGDEYAPMSGSMGSVGPDDGTGYKLPISPVVQHTKPDTVHNEDDQSQTLGYEAETQPAQKAEVDPRFRDAWKDDYTSTSHQRGSDYQSTQTSRLNNPR